MDHDEVLMLFDRQMRQRTPTRTRADGSGARVERVGDVVRQVGADGDWNGVVWSGLDPATADAAIAEQVRYFSSQGREFEWKLYSYDRPDDLGERLRAAGFVAEPEETVMVAEVRGLRTAVDLPEGVELRPVTGPAGVELVADVHEQAFGTSSARLREQLLAQLTQTPETVTMVVATADDLPVCAARMELHPGTEFASLWGGGTLPAWRGRGIYRALIAHRAGIAAERGIRYLQVDASSQSWPILRRLGFTPLSTTTPYVYGP
ncbi:GNAT family N-acetyltransferase [Streptomyces sp. NBC_01142]|uniref:GNAT family N-acetyltransferase n=1 Tax=Streptomyces sp. NBC_01142 TaxID=2975865 RepID=UPI00224C822D|nr:GNAT family N-acetyltransferase [Streptomyces sp. NBC_01142]MCX4819553.1 GNAT family N-acetyltransferase [Streptomyces sp. NBC_01142]